MRRKTIWGRVCTAVLILSLLAGAVAVVFTGGRVRPPDPLPEQAHAARRQLGRHRTAVCTA